MCAQMEQRRSYLSAPALNDSMSQSEAQNTMLVEKKPSVSQTGYLTH